MGKNDIQVFQNEEFGEVRTLMREGEPWFVAADVCRVLDHSNSRMALERLDDDEKGVSSIYIPGGKQDMQVVNEFGLYSLVLGSRKPEARKFKRWITHDVLPSIRKYGMYASSGIFTNPDTMAALVHALQHEQERGERLERRLNWLTSPSARKVLEAERARKEDAGDDLPELSARLFMEVLSEMLESGEVRVADLANEGADSDDLIGFLDDDYLHAIPQKTYEHVVRHCRAEGDSFPISRNMLHKCLRQRGVEPDEPCA
ncbi:MAG: Bro-N domain-containing protein [Candidatus Limiplasma sp.]|nr:Bro-N domain-containing protein [Candidatus Limiplasma sp.]